MSNEELKEKIDELENTVDYWIDEADKKDTIIEELEDKIEELEESIEENMIKDLPNFIRRLDWAGLYTRELEDFIENYLRFYN